MTHKWNARTSGKGSSTLIHLHLCFTVFLAVFFMLLFLSIWEEPCARDGDVKCRVFFYLSEFLGEGMRARRERERGNVM